MEYELVVIGASWGGLSALERVLGGLPADFRTPVAVAQHRGRELRRQRGEQDAQGLDAARRGADRDRRARPAHVSPFFW